MAARMIVNMSDGNIVLFGGAPESGMPDIDHLNGLTRATGDEFQAALGTIGELVRTLQASIEAMPQRPEKIEVEFGATFGSGCDLWIVSAAASPEFKIKLVWGDGG
jgi:hypothetical protein